MEEKVGTQEERQCEGKGEDCVKLQVPPPQKDSPNPCMGAKWVREVEAEGAGDVTTDGSEEQGEPGWGMTSVRGPYTACARTSSPAAYITHSRVSKRGPVEHSYDCGHTLSCFSLPSLAHPNPRLPQTTHTISSSRNRVILEANTNHDPPAENLWQAADPPSNCPEESCLAPAQPPSHLATVQPHCCLAQKSPHNR